MGYRYILAPYSGKGSRFVCPNCGKREFVPYIDSETGEVLDETCGKCNRLSNCGYHKPPSQYFQENPGARPQGESWRDAPAWLNKKQTTKKTLPLKPKTDGPLCLLPMDLVERTFPWAEMSNFVKFLYTIFDPLIVEGLIDLYKIGGTKFGEAVFYEIDREGRYRTGKIIQFNPITGKRNRDGDTIEVNWLHTVLKYHKRLPKEWDAKQCVFGEHLLDKYPDKTVCLVEAEKSAIVCTGFMPEFLWLAVGGKNQLGEKLNVLKGREVVAFPDIDAVEEWRNYFASFEGADINVEDLYEGQATEEDIKNHVDPADWFIREAQSGSVSFIPSIQDNNEMGHPFEQFRSKVTQQIAKYFSPEHLPEIDSLICELDLVPVSIQKIEEPAADEAKREGENINKQTNSKTK